MPRARPGQEGLRRRASKVLERNGSQTVKVARDLKIKSLYKENAVGATGGALHPRPQVGQSWNEIHSREHFCPWWGRNDEGAAAAAGRAGRPHAVLAHAQNEENWANPSGAAAQWRPPRQMSRKTTQIRKGERKERRRRRRRGRPFLISPEHQEIAFPCVASSEDRGRTGAALGRQVLFRIRAGTTVAIAPLC